MNNRSSVHPTLRPSRATAPRTRRAATNATPSHDPAAVSRARDTLANGALVERLSRRFRALGDPTRSKIVLALSVEELRVGDLAAALGASLSATSHQLRILRDLDIVRVRREGKTQVYALNEDAFGFCSPQVCHAWRQTLDIEPSPRRREP